MIDPAEWLEDEGQGIFADPSGYCVERAFSPIQATSVVIVNIGNEYFGQGMPSAVRALEWLLL